MSSSGRRSTAGGTEVTALPALGGRFRGSDFMCVCPLTGDSCHKILKEGLQRETLSLAFSKDDIEQPLDFFWGNRNVF